MAWDDTKATNDELTAVEWNAHVAAHTSIVADVSLNTAKTTNATHTGDVSGNEALTIAADAVTYAKMQNVVDDERILGRVSGANGVVEELTKSQVITMLSLSEGTETIGFPVESVYLPATNPAELSEELGATTYAGQSVLKFDDTTAEHGVFRSPSIIDYDGGNMVISMQAKPSTTPGGAKTLIFHIYAIGVADSEAYDSAVTVDTGVDISFNLSTATLETDMMAATATIDPANVADGDKLVLEFIRNVASDDLVGDGEIIGFDISYTRA